MGMGITRRRYLAARVTGQGKQAVEHPGLDRASHCFRLVHLVLQKPERLELHWCEAIRPPETMQQLADGNRRDKQLSIEPAALGPSTRAPRAAWATREHQTRAAQRPDQAARAHSARSWRKPSRLPSRKRRRKKKKLMRSTVLFLHLSHCSLSSFSFSLCARSSPLLPCLLSDCSFGASWFGYLLLTTTTRHRCTVSAGRFEKTNTVHRQAKFIIFPLSVSSPPWATHWAPDECRGKTRQASWSCMSCSS